MSDVTRAWIFFAWMIVLLLLGAWLHRPSAAAQEAKARSSKQRRFGWLWEDIGR